MLIEPTHKSKLPDGAKILMAEKSTGLYTWRVIIFDVDKETGALSVAGFVEAEKLPYAIESLIANGWKTDEFWFPTPDPGNFYLQSDCLSLSESAEAAMGISPNGVDPLPPKTNTDWIRDIQGALGTEETGEALVEVARNAHRAEQQLAALEKNVNPWEE